MHGVYGHHLPAAAYPIDLSEVLQLVYLNGSQPLPIQVTPLRLSPNCRTVVGHAWVGLSECRMPEGYAPQDQIAYVQQQEDPRPVATFGDYTGPTSSRVFRSHEWIEVMRVAFQHPLESCVPWYFAARGSGIFWNVGKTYVARPEDDWTLYFPRWWHGEHLPAGSVTYTVTASTKGVAGQPQTANGGPPRHAQRITYTSPICALSANLTALLRAGYDSIQFPKSQFNNFRYEMVDLRFVNSSWSAARLSCAQGATHLACVTNLTCVGEYRSGWNAHRPCVCAVRPGHRSIGCVP